MSVPFLTLPWTLGYLGDERFGIWMAVTSLITVLALAEGGVSNSLVTATSRAKARDDGDEIRQLAGASFALLVPISVAIFALAWVFVPMVSWKTLLNIKNDTAASEVPDIVIILIAALSFGFVFNVTAKIRTGLQQIPQVSAWEIASTLSAVPALIAVMYLELGAPWLVAAMVATPVVFKGLHAACFLLKHEKYRPVLRDLRLTQLRDLLGGGSMFFVVAMASAVAVSSDQLLIASFVSADAVAPYNVAYRIFALPFIMTSLVFSAQWPVYADAAVRGDVDWVRRSFGKTLALAVSVALVCSIGLSIFIDEIIYLWIGKSLEIPATLTLAMAVYSVLMVTEGACRFLMYSLDLRRELIVLSLLMMVTNL
ncbi:MAG: oligosaccharide flippase family protein, partial [Anderseniella sp.]|nr:oligosaccharide flippase family protein [Anderseniella sp.]